MSKPLIGPPCGSCPYRCDVPSGVWALDEYALLPPYDEPDTAKQPPSAFFCHQQDGRLCAGWVAVHDMPESLGLRLAAVVGLISPEVYDLALEYTSPVPLWPSGTAAAEHGVADLRRPSERAIRTIQRLERKLQRNEGRA